MEAEDCSKAEDRPEDPGFQNEGQSSAVKPTFSLEEQSPGPTVLWDMLEQKFLEYQQLIHKNPEERRRNLLSLLPLFLKVRIWNFILFLLSTQGSGRYMWVQRGVLMYALAKSGYLETVYFSFYFWWDCTEALFLALWKDMPLFLWGPCHPSALWADTMLWGHLGIAKNRVGGVNDSVRGLRWAQRSLALVYS